MICARSAIRHHTQLTTFSNVRPTQPLSLLNLFGRTHGALPTTFPVSLPFNSYRTLGRRLPRVRGAGEGRHLIRRQCPHPSVSLRRRSSSHLLSLQHLLLQGQAIHLLLCNKGPVSFHTPPSLHFPSLLLHLLCLHAPKISATLGQTVKTTISKSRAAG